MPAFRDRFYAPAVARAMTSSSGILAAGAGASAGILAGGGGVWSIVGAVVGALAGWGARVATAIPRRPERDRFDVDGLTEPWRHLVLDAQAARDQFLETSRWAKAGPMRDRLMALGARIEASVGEVYNVARAGEELLRARARIDTAAAQRDLDRVGAKASSGVMSATTEATIRSLQSQIAAAQRMDATINASVERLEFLNARLDEVVAAGIELSISSVAPDEFESVETMVSSISDELEAVRSAFEDTPTGRPQRDAAVESQGLAQPQLQPQPPSQPQLQPQLQPQTQPGSQAPRPRP
ncbi:MAG: hypothetical protein R2689_03965 [Microthrixaceae bacterium]